MQIYNNEDYGGKSINLMSCRSDSIASALRLHTRVNQTGNNEKFAVFIHDTNDVGLFNRMLFKDMVANQISIQLSFFKTNVTNERKEARPAIKMAIYSSSTHEVLQKNQEGLGSVKADGLYS